MTLATQTRPSLPPSYSEPDEGIAAPPPATATDILPAYSASNRSTRSLSNIITLSAVSSNAPLKAFRSEIKLDKKGTSVAVLKVYGDKGLSKASPTLVEGQSLRGTAKLTLEKPEGFSKLVVYVSRSPSCCSPCYTWLYFCTAGVLYSNLRVHGCVPQLRHCLFYHQYCYFGH